MPYYQTDAVYTWFSFLLSIPALIFSLMSSTPHFFLFTILFSYVQYERILASNLAGPFFSRSLPLPYAEVGLPKGAERSLDQHQCPNWCFLPRNEDSFDSWTKLKVESAWQSWAGLARALSLDSSWSLFVGLRRRATIGYESSPIDQVWGSVVSWFGDVRASFWTSIQAIVLQWGYWPRIILFYASTQRTSIFFRSCMSAWHVWAVPEQARGETKIMISNTLFGFSNLIRNLCNPQTGLTVNSGLMV